MSRMFTLVKDLLNLINQILTQKSIIFEIGTALKTYGVIIYP